MGYFIFQVVNTFKICYLCLSWFVAPSGLLLSGTAVPSVPCSSGGGGGELGVETMAVAAAAVAAVQPLAPKGQEEEEQQRQQPSSDSQVDIAPPSSDTVMVNVAGTKYSVGMLH